MTTRPDAMSAIPRHPVDLEACRQRAEALSARPEQYAQALARDAGLANMARVAAEQYAGCLAVVDPASPRICAAIRLGAHAMAAMFTAEAVPDDIVHAENWLGGFFLAAITRDGARLDALGQVPTERLRASSTRSPEYAYLYVDALRAFRQQDAQAPSLLLQALEAADPARVGEAAGHVLDIVVPQMEVLFRLMDADALGFNAALARALELHREYWSQGDRARDPRGFIAFALTALCGFAHDRGLAVAAQSDYLPLALVRGECRS
jgi:hypothetical protein